MDGYLMQSGKYESMPIRRVPSDYLHWMITADHPEAEAARAELERRKNEIGAVELSAAAVDRASLSCHHIWERTRHNREGLYSWLVRMATAALTQGVAREEGKVVAFGTMLFVFDRSGMWPILKTISAERQHGLN